MVEHHFQVHTGVDFGVVLDRLRHAVQAVHLGQQARQGAAGAQHLQHARGASGHQTLGQLLPHAFAHQGIHFSSKHHVLHQGLGGRGHCKVRPARGKARHAQDAHRVFAKRIGHMAQQFGFQVALAAMWVDQLALFVLGDGVDGQVAPRQVLLEGDIGRRMHHKAFVARRGFALGAGQGMFFSGVRVQKHRKVFAHGGEPRRHHGLGRAAHHHPVAVGVGHPEQGVPHRTTDQIGLHLTNRSRACMPTDM